MSKERKPSAPAGKKAGKTPPVPTPRPLKPQPRLLAILSVIFALWVAWLVYMYFAKVYPQRHGHAATSSQRT
jgi:hypothetical protein